MQAGWFPDPGDASQTRYWDGQAWTEHTQPVPPPSQPPARGTGLQPSWLLTAVIAIVAALIAVVATVLVAGGASDDEVADAVREALDEQRDDERDDERDTAQENACKVERKTVLTALEATKSELGDYPDELIDMVGTGDTEFLQEDPSERWGYDGSPDTLVGVGDCDGF